MTNPTVEQRANLAKLATYLERLPADYNGFHMAVYIGDAEYIYDSIDHRVENRYALENGGVPSCGAVACAIGHGPAAGVFVPSIHVEDDGVWWSRYAADVFGAKEGGALCRWLFRDRWETPDNTHYGAAARIRYFLANGIPDHWDFHGETVALYAPYRIDAVNA